MLRVTETKHGIKQPLSMSVRKKCHVIDVIYRKDNTTEGAMSRYRRDISKG